MFHDFVNHTFELRYSLGIDRNKEIVYCRKDQLDWAWIVEYQNRAARLEFIPASNRSYPTLLPDTTLYRSNVSEINLKSW